MNDPNRAFYKPFTELASILYPTQPADHVENCIYD